MPVAKTNDYIAKARTRTIINKYINKKANPRDKTTDGCLTFRPKLIIEEIKITYSNFKYSYHI